MILTRECPNCGKKWEDKLARDWLHCDFCKHEWTIYQQHEIEKKDKRIADLEARLKDAEEVLRVGGTDCRCEIAIENPMVHNHSRECELARAYFKKWGK